MLIAFLITLHVCTIHVLTLIEGNIQTALAGYKAHRTGPREEHPIMTSAKHGIACLCLHASCHACEQLKGSYKTESMLFETGPTFFG